MLYEVAKATSNNSTPPVDVSGTGGDWSHTVKAVHVVCATVGVVPSVLAACDDRLLICAMSFLATGAALGHISVSESRALVPGAVDALTSVLLTVSCAIALCSHRSLVGVLRVLWLIVLITSSCGFNFVQARFPSLSIIPNDITIGALVAAALLLCACAYVEDGARARRDNRSMVVEVIFGVGALALRFRTDIARIATVDIGLGVWHTCQWSAVLATLCILRTPPSENRVVLDPSSVGFT